jgi:MYXO-CTERM domain-containing protein
VLAQSFDAANQPIFGVTYTWNLAGEEATGVGDLFEFPFASGQSNVVSAQFGSLSAQTSIEAKPGTGFVSSSNDLGCSASSGPPRGSFAALGLAALALAFTVRRRRDG